MHCGAEVTESSTNKQHHPPESSSHVQQNISFLPDILSTWTSTRMYGEFLRLLFLQAHRETESHFTADGRANRAGTRAWLVG